MHHLKVEVLTPRKIGHAPEFALLKCHIFLSKGRGGGIRKFTLQ